MRVTHVITSLNNGGAQAVLYNLLKHNPSNQHFVLCLSAPGKYSSMIEALGVDVVHMNMPRGGISLSGLLKLYRTMQSRPSDVVQTWMYHADLIGGIAARLTGRKNIVWGIHHTSLSKKGTSRKTRAVVWLLKHLSRSVPKAIISCSRKGLEIHADYGYRRAKLTFVGNGYDLEKFRPAAGSLQSLELVPDIPQDTFVFLNVARWDPQKDHRNLVAAVSILGKITDEPFTCLMVGPNVDNSNADLVSWLDEYHANEYISLCGVSSSVSELMNYADCHVLPSLYGEAFPNVVAEAMSCALPCIVTDVGDAAEMVGDCGWVVPPGDPTALAETMKQCIEASQSNTEWQQRKDECRARAVAHFDIHSMIASYQSVWEQDCNDS